MKKAIIAYLKSTFTETLYAVSSAASFLANKTVAIVILFHLMAWYEALPSGEGAATPFAELLYVVILIVGSSVVAPLIRLLIFPEAAEYAEQGHLRRDLETPLAKVEAVELPTPETVMTEWAVMATAEHSHYRFSPALVHYWYATGLSWLATIACAATLTH